MSGQVTLDPNWCKFVKGKNETFVKANEFFDQVGVILDNCHAGVLLHLEKNGDYILDRIIDAFYSDQRSRMEQRKKVVIVRLREFFTNKTYEHAVGSNNFEGSLLVTRMINMLDGLNLTYSGEFYGKPGWEEVTLKDDLFAMSLFLHAALDIYSEKGVDLNRPLEKMQLFRWWNRAGITDMNMYFNHPELGSGSFVVEPEVPTPTRTGIVGAIRRLCRRI